MATRLSVIPRRHFFALDALRLVGVYSHTGYPKIGLSRKPSSPLASSSSTIARPSAIITAMAASIFWSGRCLVGYRLPLQSALPATLPNTTQGPDYHHDAADQSAFGVRTNSSKTSSRTQDDKGGPTDPVPTVRFLDVEAITAVRRRHLGCAPERGLPASCWRNSSVAQICPGSTCGSTRLAHSTASPPTTIGGSSPTPACMCTSP